VWQHGPFAGEIRQGRMYGRGTADMKGGLAAMAGALVLLAQDAASVPRDVLLMGTVGEEVDCSGMRAFVEQDAFHNVGAIVIGEPTALEIGTAHKGALWISVTVSGQSAHGSMPSLGSNAILNASRFLNALEQLDFGLEPHPLLGRPTLSPDQIVGGTAPNVVPDSCSITIDVRTIPPQRHADVRNAIHELAEKTIQADTAAAVRTEILLDRAPLDTSPSDLFVRAALSIRSALLGAHPPGGFTYFTDGSIIVQSYTIPTIIWGPGEPGQAHRVDESIPLESVVAAATAYKRLAFSTEF
jgi:succinyl-diaminopimelate desuccinylase